MAHLTVPFRSGHRSLPGRAVRVRAPGVEEGLDAVEDGGERRDERFDRAREAEDEVDGDLFMHGSGEFAYALAEKGLVDVYEIYVKPLVWGNGNRHVLGDRGRSA